MKVIYLLYLFENKIWVYCWVDGNNHHHHNIIISPGICQHDKGQVSRLKKSFQSRLSIVSAQSSRPERKICQKGPEAWGKHACVNCLISVQLLQPTSQTSLKSFSPWSHLDHFIIVTGGSGWDKYHLQSQQIPDYQVKLQISVAP